MTAFLWRVRVRTVSPVNPRELGFQHEIGHSYWADTKFYSIKYSDRVETSRLNFAFRREVLHRC